MKALIFAAGIGTRLRPFTLHHPKALAPVGGRPALQHVIQRLAAQGVDHFVVNVHHFAGQIIEFLDSLDLGPGIAITVSDESDRLLDTGGGLLRALPLLQDPLAPHVPVILHNADILTDQPIAPIVSAHLDGRNAATLLVSTTRESSRSLLFNPADGTMAGWRDNRTGATRPASVDPSAVPMAFDGMHIVDPDRLAPALVSYKERCAPSDGVFSITDFYIDSCPTLPIRAFSSQADTRWVDIGRPESLQRASALFPSI